MLFAFASVAWQSNANEWVAEIFEKPFYSKKPPKNPV